MPTDGNGRYCIVINLNCERWREGVLQCFAYKLLRPRVCDLWGADILWGGDALEPMLEQEVQGPALGAADLLIFQIGLEHGVAGF